MGTSQMDSENVDFAGILSVLADDLSRNILSLLSERSLAVSEIVERYDVSDRTIYRRIHDLKAHDLVDETTRIDSQGQLYSKYRTSVERIDIDVAISPGEDQVDVDLTYRDDVDGFIDLWGGLRARSVEPDDE